MPDFSAIATIIVQVLNAMPTVWKEALAFWEAIHGQDPVNSAAHHADVMNAINHAAGVAP